MLRISVLNLVAEPTAAAVAYGVDNLKNDSEKIICVYDLGGGTFDVSILSVRNGNFDVLGTSGDNHSGGEDFTNTLVEYCITQFNKKRKKVGRDDIQVTPKSRSLLYNECEEQKQLLSQAPMVTVHVDNFFEQIDLHIKVTRTFFENLIRKPLEKIIEEVFRALSNANVDRMKVDDIVLVGGSTKIPKVAEMLKVFFGKSVLKRNFNPDEAVAQGAALKANAVVNSSTENPILLYDVTP